MGTVKRGIGLTFITCISLITNNVGPKLRLEASSRLNVQRTEWGIECLAAGMDKEDVQGSN